MSEPTLTWQALEDYVRETTIDRIARATGLYRDSVCRARRLGYIRLLTGERIADHMRCHPAEIWPEYHDVILAQMEWKAGENARRAERERRRRRAA